jgi:hypothetical protein
MHTYTCILHMFNGLNNTIHFGLRLKDKIMALTQKKNYLIAAPRICVFV